MFGIDGIEFLIILIIMIVVVGPKDLPKMMRAFGQATTKMRKTALEFRRHFDEAMREAELGEISDTLKEVKKLDPRKNLTEIFDPIREVTNDIKASLGEPVVSPPVATSLEQDVSAAVPIERPRKKRTRKKTTPKSTPTKSTPTKSLTEKVAEKT